MNMQNKLWFLVAMIAGLFVLAGCNSQSTIPAGPSVTYTLDAGNGVTQQISSQEKGRWEWNNRANGPITAHITKVNGAEFSGTIRFHGPDYAECQGATELTGELNTDGSITIKNRCSNTVRLVYSAGKWVGSGDVGQVVLHFASPGNLGAEITAK